MNIEIKITAYSIDIRNKFYINKQITGSFYSFVQILNCISYFTGEYYDIQTFGDNRRVNIQFLANNENELQKIYDEINKQLNNLTNFQIKDE